MSGGDAAPLPKPVAKQFWLAPGVPPAGSISDLQSLMMDDTDPAPVELQPGCVRACDGFLEMHDSIPSLSTALSVVRPSATGQGAWKPESSSAGLSGVGGTATSAASEIHQQKGQHDFFFPWSIQDMASIMTRTPAIQEKELGSNTLLKPPEAQERHLPPSFSFDLPAQSGGLQNLGRTEATECNRAGPRNEPITMGGGTRFLVQPGGILRHESVLPNRSGEFGSGNKMLMTASEAPGQMQAHQPRGFSGAPNHELQGSYDTLTEPLTVLSHRPAAAFGHPQPAAFRENFELEIPVELNGNVALCPSASNARPIVDVAVSPPKEPKLPLPAAKTSRTMKPRSSSRAKGSSSKGKQAAKATPSARSSKYRGVTKHRRSGRWEAHIWVKEIGRQVYLGGYESEDHAAEAYDVAAIKCKGENVKTNFDKIRYKELIGYIDNITLEELVMSVRRQSQGFARGSSRYRGVTHHPTGRWEARIGVPGSKHIYLGLFNDEDKAGSAYDRALVLLRGSTAATNFSLSDYREQLAQYHQIQRDVLANGKLDGQAVLRATSEAIRHGIEGRSATKGARVEPKTAAEVTGASDEAIQWLNDVTGSGTIQDQGFRGFKMAESLPTSAMPPRTTAEHELPVAAQCDGSMAFSGDELQPFM